MRVRLLLTAIALPLLLWAVLPMPSSGKSKQQELQELQSKISNAREKIGRKKGTERALSLADRRLRPPHPQAAGQDRVAADAPAARPDRPRRQARRAREPAHEPARRARPPRAPAQAPRRDAHPAARAPRRDLQGRAAGHGHRGPQLRRLHRPARARRVHQAHLRAGPADRDARARRQDRLGLQREAPDQARGAPAQGHRDRPEAPRRDRRRAHAARRHARRLHAHEERQGRRAEQRARRPPAPRGSRRRPRGGVAEDRQPAQRRRRAGTRATCRSGAATAA